ncbi:MAG: VanW family protein [Deltaproteobacteria bacterium]|nr:VanW family protein [Deltaproteobacteria bacterium]
MSQGGGAGRRAALEWVVLSGAFLLAGAAAGAVLRPPAEADPQAPCSVATVAVPEGGGSAAPAGPVAAQGSRVRLAGRVIDLARPLRPQVLAAAREYLSAEVTLRAGEESFSATRAQLGAVVPVGHIVEGLERAREGDSPLGRLLAAGTDVHELPILVELDDQTALGRLIAFKNRFDRSVESARFDFVAGMSRPESSGRHLMLYRALAAIQDALEDGTAAIDLPVQVTAPALTAAELAGHDFSQVLGWYETPYSRMPEQETRNYNLRLAGSFVDGSVVLPGERLSLNEVIGPRTEVRGFKVAPVIAEGELIDGIGGGTCQIASTTFAASFFAGLDLVRRKPHSRPSGYILLGLDATVVYPTIDFVLRNPFDFPIALRVTVADAKVRVEVRGARRVYDVTFVRDVYQVTDFHEQVVEMPDWPAGVEVLSQRGVKGYRMKRHRILCEGTACWRESAESHYPPTTQIVRRGTNTSMSRDSFTPPKGDGHPPYSADRHMLVAQRGDELQILRR